MELLPCSEPGAAFVKDDALQSVEDNRKMYNRNMYSRNTSDSQLLLIPVDRGLRAVPPSPCSLDA